MACLYMTKNKKNFSDYQLDCDSMAGLHDNLLSGVQWLDEVTKSNQYFNLSVIHGQLFRIQCQHSRSIIQRF